MDLFYSIANLVPASPVFLLCYIFIITIPYIFYLIVTVAYVVYFFKKYNQLDLDDYMVLASILAVFIYIGNKDGLTLISGLLAVYALFYSTMSANYSSRKVVINSWAEKAVDHLRQFKDSDLAVKVAQMQLVDKPNYFKVRDVLWYRSNKQELAEKKLDVSYADDKLIIKIAEKIIYENEESVKINEKIIPESEYMVGKKIEWIKIYAKLDIEQYAVELIKKEFEVMAKNGVFAGTKFGDEWKNDADLQKLWLHGAHLVGAHLQGAHLIVAQLQGADLSEAQLQGAHLIVAQLQGADLRGAQLQGADLRVAQLQGANLSVAKLQGANLDSVQLQGAVMNYYNKESKKFEKILLTEAILDETDKYKDDLPNFDGVKNIDSAIFSDDDKEGTNKKVIAKIKQMYKLP